MHVYERVYRCSLCGVRSEHRWSVFNYRWGHADLDQRSRDVHLPLTASVQRCPACGLCARRIDQAGDEFARAAMASPEYAALTGRADLPQLARTYLLASCVERTRGFAGRAAWFALSAGWVCDDAGNESGARDARLIAIVRLREARERRVHIVQGMFDAPPRGFSAIVFIDTARKAGEMTAARHALYRFERWNTRDLQPWVNNAIAFEEHLIRKGDTANYRQDDADAWGASRLFASLPPTRTLKSAGWSLGQNPEDRAPSAPALEVKPPSGVRPVFLWLSQRPFSLSDSMSARWGRDAVEHIDTNWFDYTLADTINAMFPAMHRTWRECKYMGIVPEENRDLRPRGKRSPIEWEWPLKFSELDIGKAFAARRAARAARAQRRREIAAAALEQGPGPKRKPKAA